MSLSLSRKRKKELRRLQDDANQLWHAQQEIVAHAANVAREAGRQLGNFRREQVVPTVQENYERHVAPVVDRGVSAGRHVLNNKVVPIVGGVVGSAMTVWDAANAKRQGIPFAQFRAAAPVPVPEKKRSGLGSVVAVVLGVAAAVGVLAAAWQALRADDELWIADEPTQETDAA